MSEARIFRTVLLGFLACGGAAQATELVLYKTVLPNGTISYSDKPLPGVRARTFMVEPHPADPRAAQEAETAAAMRQKQMLAISMPVRRAPSSWTNRSLPQQMLLSGRGIWPSRL